MKSKKAGIFLIRLILGITNTILILMIIINLSVLLSTKILKDKHPSLLDYTYYIVTENNSKFGFTKGDLLLIDMREVINKDDIIMYKNKSGYHIEKVEISENEVTLTNDEKIPKEDVIGKKINSFKKLGAILETILKPIALIIAIILLTITSIIQSLINKNTKKVNPKPNFNQIK